MPTGWRLVKTKHLDSALSGEGAFRFGARWTSKGQRAVYASSTSSLAILEVLAHLGDTRPFPAYSIIPLEIPQELITAVCRHALPPNWRDYPAPSALRTLGDAWLASAVSACWRVPSVLAPDIEWADANYVLNPTHPDFGQITKGEPISLEFDARL